MADFTVKVTKDGVPALLKAVRLLVKDEVVVGVPDRNADRKPDPGDPNPPSNAAIAYIMETGAPERNIPARPFLQPGIENAAPQIIAQLKKTGLAALTGQTKKIDQGHHAVGLIAQNAVRAKITDGPFVPLAEMTLAMRRARGRTGTKPLIDTGQLRNSVTYVVRPKGKK